jgi:hypothetical protein
LFLYAFGLLAATKTLDKRKEKYVFIIFFEKINCLKLHFCILGKKAIEDASAHRKINS